MYCVSHVALFCFACVLCQPCCPIWLFVCIVLILQLCLVLLCFVSAMLLSFALLTSRLYLPCCHILLCCYIVSAMWPYFALLLYCVSHIALFCFASRLLVAIFCLCQPCCPVCVFCVLYQPFYY